MSIGVFGEGVIDRFLDAAGNIDVIGGSALNCAVALKRAGVDANWISRVSNDDAGDLLASYATKNGVASEKMLRRSQPTSIVTIAMQPNGVPIYGFHLEGSVDWQWSRAELDEVFSGLNLLQLSSLSCVLSPGAEHLPDALAELKKNNPDIVITYDPNARPKAAQNSAHAEIMKQRILHLVTLADLVKVSDEDLAWIAPSLNAENVAAEWSLLGPKLVVLTKGEAGSQAFVSGKLMASTTIHSMPMIDTVGAGDTYMAWLIRSIVEEHGFKVPTDSDKIHLIIDQASKAAAINCSRKGCHPPYREEVLT